MAEQLSLKQLSSTPSQLTNDSLKWNPGQNLTRSQLSLRRSIIVTRGGVEEDVLVRDVNEIIEESKWGPLLDKGFERIAYLLEGANTIPVGKRERRPL